MQLPERISSCNQEASVAKKGSVSNTACILSLIVASAFRSAYHLRASRSAKRLRPARSLILTMAEFFRARPVQTAEPRHWFMCRFRRRARLGRDSAFEFDAQIFIFTQCGSVEEVLTLEFHWYWSFHSPGSPSRALSQSPPKDCEGRESANQL